MMLFKMIGFAINLHFQERIIVKSFWLSQMNELYPFGVISNL